MTPSVAAQLLASKRLLVFDLDGTLIDSSPLHARAFGEAFAPYGIDVDYSSIAGLTTATAVDRVASRAGLVLSTMERERLIAEKQARSLRLISSELQPIKGAVEFVRAAEGRFARALCTSASRAGADAALTKVGLVGQFDPLITAEVVARGKPDPEAFLMALEAHGVPAEEALVFEDAESGLSAAGAAAIDAVQIKSGVKQGSSWAPFLAALELLQ
jgi:HAD superfamily hydrolase (TIGR01509 family)